MIYGIYKFIIFYHKYGFQIPIQLTIQENIKAESDIKTKFSDVIGIEEYK